MELTKMYEQIQAWQKAIAEGTDLMQVEGLVGDTAEARLAYVKAQSDEYLARKAAVGIDLGDAPATPKFDLPAPAPVAVPNVNFGKATDPTAVGPNTFYNLMKADNDFGSYVKDGGLTKGNQQAFVKVYGEGDVDFTKATLTAAGTIAAAPIVAAAIGPMDFIDNCYFQPWNLETYRRRIQGRTGAVGPLRRATQSNPLSDPTSWPEGDAVLGTADFPLLPVGVVQYVGRQQAMADPMVISSTVDIMMKDVRLALQAQVLGGDGANGNLTGLVGQLTGNAFTAAATAGQHVLEDLLYPRIAGIHEAAGMMGANYILCNGANASRIKRSLQNLRAPESGAVDAPYGRALTATVLIVPGMPANTVIIGTFGDANFHVIPIRAGVEVIVNPWSATAQDEIEISARIYAANVVNRPQGFFRITAAAAANFVIDDSP